MASYASDDLTPLLGVAQAPGVGYRQGTIRAWDSETAENTVEVDGVLLSNLSILNTSEALLLSPGDVVGILTTGSAARSWCILGRLTIPGTPQAATALQIVSSRIVAATDPDAGTRSASAYGDLTGASVGPSVSMRVRSSGKALAIFSCQQGFTGAFETSLRGSASVAVSGATTVAASGSWGLGFAYELFGGSTLSFVPQGAGMHLFTGLNPGDHTFTMQYRSLTGQAITFEERELCVFAM